MAKKGSPRRVVTRLQQSQQLVWFLSRLPSLPFPSSLPFDLFEKKKTEREREREREGRKRRIAAQWVMYCTVHLSPVDRHVLENTVENADAPRIPCAGYCLKTVICAAL